MKLSPFTLSECEQFYRSRHISMTRYQILQSYMVIGGIPFYMNYFNPSLSLAQNIDKLFFAQKEQKLIRETDFWEHHLNEVQIKSWCGIAFEEVCFNHIEQIKKALGIAGVSTTETAYIAKGDAETAGMQIDMLINRRDDVIKLCELKYYENRLSID